jgi:hypothetical protein
MKEPVTGVVVFFRTLRNCISSSWKETDSQYHIPKSRFHGVEQHETGRTVNMDHTDSRLKSNYLRRFRYCLTSAWDAADSHYHIPKSRHAKDAPKQI